MKYADRSYEASSLISGSFAFNKQSNRQNYRSHISEGRSLQHTY